MVPFDVNLVGDNGDRPNPKPLWFVWFVSEPPPTGAAEATEGDDEHTSSPSRVVVPPGPGPGPDDAAKPRWRVRGTTWRARRCADPGNPKTRHPPRWGTAAADTSRDIGDIDIVSRRWAHFVSA
tara:strand:- start:2034 stop:2405 length:372 start_codon:yes stop_codon:yes gene_type:complete